MADFDAPSGFAFTWDAALAERIYLDLRDKMGPSFHQQSQDAETYADAMCLAVAQLQIEEAANQTDPARTSFLIDEIEKDYLVCPTVGASLADRRANLAAVMAGASGSTDAAIQAGLSTLLGANLLGWRTMRTRVPPDVWGGAWQDITTNLGMSNARDIAYDASINRWIVVTDSAASISDDNGNTWTGISMWGYLWHAVASANGVSVAVALTTSTQKISTSEDGGETWTMRTVAGSDVLRAVCYSPTLDMWVAVGDGGLTATSTDLVTWTPDWSNGTWFNWLCVTWGGDRFVALSAPYSGTSYAQYSTDGVTWTTAELPLDSNWDGITHNGSLFVGTEGANVLNRVISSVDGITWTAHVSGDAPAPSFSSIAFDGSAFIRAVGESNALYSRDLTTWVDSGQVLGTSLVKIAAGGGYVISVNDAGGAWRLHPDFDGDAQVFPALAQGTSAPIDAPVRVARISGTSALGVGTVDQFPINDTEANIKAGDLLTVGVGKVSEEVVTVMEITFRIIPPFVAQLQLKANFSKYHQDGDVVTTQRYSRWGSSARHYMIFTTAAVVLDSTTLAKIHTLMRKMVTVASTWAVVETEDGWRNVPMRVGGRVGMDAIGSVLVNE